MPTRRDHAAKIVVLSGPAGSGKTTLCQRIVAAARTRGLVVRGIVSPPRFVEGVKSGIDVLDLRSGECRALAESSVATSGPTTAGWSFHVGALAWGMDVLRSAVPCDLLVVDELGPLELVRNEGWAEAVHLLRGGGYRWAVVVVRPELAELFAKSVTPVETTIVNVASDDPNELLEQMSRLWTDDDA